MKKRLKIKDAIYQLEEQGFEKTLDSISEYSTNADLYFRGIGNNRYIVFNHYNKTKREDLQGFDCWISKYKSKNEIGKKKAIKTDDIRLSFDFEEDWKLLTSHLN